MVPLCAVAFVERFRRYMEGLPNHISFDYVGKKMGVLHGAMEHISEFIFQSSPEDIKL